MNTGNLNINQNNIYLTFLIFFKLSIWYKDWLIRWDQSHHPLTEPHLKSKQNFV